MEMQPIQAEFNSGLAIIFQLDNIEKELILATYNSDYQSQYRLLTAYWKTLYPHCKKDDKEKYIAMWNQIKENMRKITDATNKGKNKIPKSLIDELDFWEMELRELKQKHGLGMPKKDPRFAMM